MAGRDFSKPLEPLHLCLSKIGNNRVYKIDGIYPLLCYDCQRKSDKETQATKPKNNKYTKYDKSL